MVVDASKATSKYRQIVRDELRRRVDAGETTVTAVADSLGLAVPTLSMWLSGVDRKLSLSTVDRLAKLLDVKFISSEVLGE